MLSGARKSFSGQLTDWGTLCFPQGKESITRRSEAVCLARAALLTGGDAGAQDPPLTRSTCLWGWHKYKQQAAERESTPQGSEERVCCRPCSSIVAEKSSNNWMHCFSDVLNPSASAGVAHLLYLHKVPAEWIRLIWSPEWRQYDMTIPCTAEISLHFWKDPVWFKAVWVLLTCSKRFQSCPKYEEAACEQ